MRRSAFLLLGLSALLLAVAPPPARSTQGLVATDHRLASAAGAEVLAAGGNATDAAAAAALACGVVQPSASGLGGGGFAVSVAADGAASVLDFREVAPASAHARLFADHPDPKASTVGGLAIAVPSEGPGLAALHARGGRLPWRAVVAPALRLAKDGFRAGSFLVASLGRQADGGAALSRALFGLPERPDEGDLLRRGALARTLEALGRGGQQELTAGSASRELLADLADAGSPITAADLAAVAPKARAPLVGAYRGWRVTTMPPPSSGGAVLLQALAVLEGFDLAVVAPDGADRHHLVAEVLQHAFADRARLMGDPDRAPVPVAAMLAPARIAAIRASILPGRTFAADHYGTRVDAGTDAGTQHISVVDAAGNAVALTTTVNTSFGSLVVGRRTGIVFNNEMDDFVARPGEPNAFGLVGSAANAVAPGARPLSSMTPTVLEHPDGRRIVVGASGGPQIISATLQVILAIVDDGLDPAAAVAAPRVHHQWMPRELVGDRGVSPDTLAALRGRGHTVVSRPHYSAVQAVVWDRRTGVALGASDPRKGGAPWAPGGLP